MDDGYKNGNINSFYELAASRFTEEEIQTAIDIFQSKFNIKAKRKENNRNAVCEGLTFDVYDSYALSQLMRNSEVGKMIYDSIDYKFINMVTFNRTVKPEKFKIPVNPEHIVTLTEEIPE